MQVNNARAAMAQYDANRSISGLAAFEFFFLAVCVGIFNGSWLLGILVFFIPLILIGIPGVREFFVICMGIVWAYFGARFGSWVSGPSTATGLAIIFGLVSLATHNAFLEMSKDLAHNDAAEPTSPDQTGIVLAKVRDRLAIQKSNSCFDEKKAALLLRNV